MFPLVVLLTIGLPLLWFATEFQDRRWLRIIAGCTAIAVSFLVAAGVGALEHFNANAWYGSASKNLIDATVEELQQGDEEQLLRELKVLQEKFHPTYENRARYDILIDEFLKRLGKESKQDV